MFLIRKLGIRFALNVSDPKVKIFIFLEIFLIRMLGFSFHFKCFWSESQDFRFAQDFR